MDSKIMYDFGQENAWDKVFVYRREGYKTSVTDYHEHKFYEINLIVSGNVKILLGDCFEECRESRLVLTAPDTPHYITCRPDTLYRRVYLAFTEDFVSHFLPEWGDISRVFGDNGAIVALSPSQTIRIRQIIEEVEQQKTELGKRLLIYYLLLQIAELGENERVTHEKKPAFLMRAIAYIEENYSERIVAEELAKRLYVGRTTLMTEFKKSIGCTVNEYLTDCRLKNAVKLLEDGETVEQTAERCGFSDSSGLTRAFKRKYNCAPKQYIRHSASGRF